MSEVNKIERFKIDNDNEQNNKVEVKNNNIKEIEHNELTINRYVIATFGNPTTYLRTMDGKDGATYLLTDTLEYASKTYSKTIAKYLLQMYRDRTGDMQDFVVLPLRIRYYLLERVDNNTDNTIDITL